MKIIVGLGNPGPKYAGNRHNIGFMVVDALAEKARTTVEKRSHRSLAGQGRLGGEGVLLVKPQTFMNLSGEAVEPILAENRCTPSDLIVIHDDLDLAFGLLRIRKTGGDGGHNGIASIIENLGTGSFVRIKMGIGRPPSGMNPADYVLSDFLAEEYEILKEMIASAVSAVLGIIHEGPEKAMNRINRKSKPEE